MKFLLHYEKKKVLAERRAATIHLVFTAAAIFFTAQSTTAAFRSMRHLKLSSFQERERRRTTQTTRAFVRRRTQNGYVTIRAPEMYWHKRSPDVPKNRALIFF